jgi:flagellin
MSAVTLNSNVGSINAQRRLGESTAALGKSLERLSSGLRINRARDDAAGLAISASLAVGVKVLGQTLRNIGDAISLIDIASEGIHEQNGILQRMAELAQQSANGVQSADQRKNIQREYESLIAEYQRIGETTQFNGIRPLHASPGGTSETLLINTDESGSGSHAILLTLPATSSTAGIVGLKGDLSGNGSLSGTDANRAVQFASRGGGPYLGLPPPTLDEANDFYDGPLLHATLTDSGGREREVYFVLAPYSQAVVGITDETNVIGLSANGSGGLDYLGSFGSFVLGTENNIALTFSDTGAAATASVNLTDISYSFTDLDGPVRRTAINFTGVESASRARSALETVGNRLEDINLAAGELGAGQSRLAAAYESAVVKRENFQSARSRIVDADIAEEAAHLVKIRILQQVGTAVLGQANQLPRLALDLLQF